MAEIYNCIVIGAGWFGLAAAKSYIELHPTEKVLIVEAESSCGGTWSHDRLYPGLKSNNLWGSYEYPDFPMVEEVYGVKYGEHIPAATLHRYLTDFAKKFGVFERTRFNTAVDAIESVDDGSWKIHVKPTKGDGKPEILHTKKLIVASGLTSNPNLPTYPGQETFTPPFFHAKDFRTHADTVKTCKRAVIVGGAKSAFDCAYAYATEGGAQVDLIVRPSGQGPVWISPPWVTPLKRMMEELLSTRALTWFSPVPWDDDGYGVVRKFLHGTLPGNLMVKAFWSLISSDIVEAHGFNEHPEVFKLKPWHGAQWTGSGVSIHNYDTNFFDLIREGKVRVHIADVERLDGTTVHLTDGQALATDVVICATGWKKDSGIRHVNFDTGLPHSKADKERLSDAADQQVREMFPGLKDQPVLRYTPIKQEPLRNYRFIVPTNAVFKRNIAFAGMVSTVCTATFASVQALWISAFLDGKLKRSPKNDAEVLKEVMLHTQFGKWRYPCGYGAAIPDFAFDSVPYVDLLVNDLGLNPRRKASQMAELVEPYKPKDYKGLTEEWVASLKGL
ncbi:uncharacterized protein E0L32_002940 [Thyridium curvatum]|uniref:Flavin-containing monooxygenase n=1 Tax=Thyridium curvatum TaxID=1093900 RepID=A0A507BK79_9PEZI|nr:uncharacterized protein E0L32_002940 [Thyridium curvatum]TPX17839.1 hypothetical protein E0L32_002940 [Thyridium curvatum]